MYHIDALCPRRDINGGAFTIQLWPEFKERVAKSELNQEMANTAIKNMHRAWLDGCGYDDIFDPDEDPMERWKAKHGLEHKKPGPRAHPLYDEHSLRVQWGEWGPEHITVPGNACGLDLDHGYSAPKDGRVLLPHNVDTRDQALLLLVVFTWFAGTIILRSDAKARTS